MNIKEHTLKTLAVIQEQPDKYHDIVVTDLQGRTLLELPVTTDTAELDTSTWPRGTVIVTLHTAQGKAVKKLALK